MRARLLWDWKTGLDIGGLRAPTRLVPPRTYCPRAQVSRQAPTCPVEWVDSEHPLFLLYTSGSTGGPRLGRLELWGRGVLCVCGRGGRGVQMCLQERAGCWGGVGRGGCS